MCQSEHGAQPASAYHPLGRLTPLPCDGATRTTPAIPDMTVQAGQAPCAALAERGVQMALAGDREGAERGLVAATRLCPTDPASWRELAGLTVSGGPPALPGDVTAQRSRMPIAERRTTPARENPMCLR